MKSSGGIVILVFVIFGLFLSYSSLAAEEVSKDIAAFRSEFHTALDQIKRANAGKTPDPAILSVSTNNMKRILDAMKQRTAGKQATQKGTKSQRTADEAALKEMMDQVKRDMNACEQQKVERDKDNIKEHLAKIMDMIKELLKIHKQITEAAL